ncbi:DUF5704 domain-containing protein [Neobacillus mesonae]|nr:DUF5704 domain-containing protein [Neobacillus mesonae]
MSQNTKAYYEDATSPTYSLCSDNQTQGCEGWLWTGKGTNIANIPIYVTNGLLYAIDPVNRRLEQEAVGVEFGPNVEGYRYFFPTLFTIELEPEEGNAIIKHYTTRGQSLNGVNGFTDREEKLVKNETYAFTHTPGNNTYKYVGHKKSTVSAPSGGTPSPGDPYSFTYDGSFPTYYLFFYYETDDTGPDPPTAGCTAPVPASNLTGKYMDPVATGVIKADERGSERFDVLQGIPTSESLYGNILARNYLFENKFTEMQGVCTYKVNVEQTWNLTWDPKTTDEEGNEVPDPQSDEEVVTEQYEIIRPYSYWVIDQLEVYEIDQALLQNYALPNDKIIMYPKGYEGPRFTVTSSGQYYPPEIPGTVVAPGGSKDGGTSRPEPDSEDLSSYAEDAVDSVDVTNDSLIFNGQTIISSNKTQESGPTPGKIPAPQSINENVLYEPGNIISSNKVNRANTTSAGSIGYRLLPGSIGGGDKEFPIYGINTVTVHTPVVNYSSVTDDQAHNQKTRPNESRAAFILDRPFKIRIPTSGQHVSYPGYGHRDYAKYVRVKQVYFPFDVYSADRRSFYPKNTWITVPTLQLETEFFLPVWVDEGDYTVYFRTIAENAPGDFTHETNANMSLAHHAATDSADVEVIGRVYDFRVTDIADYEWESVFREQLGSSIPTGFSYWVGLNGIDGGFRGNNEPFILPIRPGSHPEQGYANVSVKTGYHFKFDLKTKGNMFDADDGIRITPAFYYVASDGSQRQEVDLYYSKGFKHFIRIGSPQDEEKRYVLLNERLRNVPLEELTDTAAFYYNTELTDTERNQIPFAVYTENYMLSKEKESSWAGRYHWMVLSDELRTFIGPKSNLPAEVNRLRANAAIQHWYGEYSLPADTVAVKKGTDLAAYSRSSVLDDQSDILLKDGYIVVNFNIETIQNGDTANPHLQYIHAPLMNQWQLEGFHRKFTTPAGGSFIGEDGDVLYYYSHLSSRNDFSSQVPH